MTSPSRRRPLPDPSLYEFKPTAPERRSVSSKDEQHGVLNIKIGEEWKSFEVTIKHAKVGSDLEQIAITAAQILRIKGIFDHEETHTLLSAKVSEVGVRGDYQKKGSTTPVHIVSKHAEGEKNTSQYYEIINQLGQKQIKASDLTEFSKGRSQSARTGTGARDPVNPFAQPIVADHRTRRPADIEEETHDSDLDEPEPERLPELEPYPLRHSTKADDTGVGSRNGFKFIIRPLRPVDSTPQAKAAKKAEFQAQRIAARAQERERVLRLRTEQQPRKYPVSPDTKLSDETVTEPRQIIPPPKAHPDLKPIGMSLGAAFLDVTSGLARDAASSALSGINSVARILGSGLKTKTQELGSGLKSKSLNAAQSVGAYLSQNSISIEQLHLELQQEMDMGEAILKREKDNPMLNKTLKDQAYEEAKKHFEKAQELIAALLKLDKKDTQAKAAKDTVAKNLAEIGNIIPRGDELV